MERLDPQVSRCGRIESTLWYRVDTAPDGLIALTVKGAAGVAPVLRIYRRTASAIQEVDCASAGPRGSASASLETVRGSSYLVLVGRRPSTPDGGFELRAELFLPPGNDNRAGAQAIPKLPGSVRGTARRPSTPLLPAPTEPGSTCSRSSRASEAASQGYRLLFAPAAADDLGVGIELRNRVRASGSLDPARLDVRDLYHFDVERRGDLRLDVTNGLRFELLRDDGRRLGSHTSPRRRLEPGRYVVAVTASFGDAAARYQLSLLIREITSTTLRLASATVAPGSPVTLRPEVANASGGTVEIQIDRFDPLTGWHVNRLLRVPAGGTTTWAPPAEGRWRLRATYKGTTESSPSRSGYVQLLVRRL